MDIITIMENVSDVDIPTPLPTIDVDQSSSIKKSILHSSIRGTSATSRIQSTDSPEAMKRAMSRSQIQWKEVPGKMEEERKFIKSSCLSLGILSSRGYKWHYIHEPMFKVRWEESKPMKQSDEEAHRFHTKPINNFTQDLGSRFLQKRLNKNVELDLTQQTCLEILKHKIKEENDAYLSRHPEVNIMTKQIFTAIFQNLPQNPKQFVSDYVHHLNKHREELVLEDVDIPFDRPLPPQDVTEDITSEEEERQRISVFARDIVETCLNIASLGESHVDVMTIINLMLKTVSPSEDKVSINSMVTDAETAVSEVLMSLMTSVPIKSSTSAERIVDEVLDSILSNALPFIHSGSIVYSEMRNSVASFIQSLINQLIDNFEDQIVPGEMLSEEEEKSREMISVVESDVSLMRSILKKELNDEEQKTESKTKVKFQSINKSDKDLK